MRGAPYSCAGCRARVGLRAGEQLRPHFAHRPSPTGLCGPETVKHTLAKLLIADVVRRWLAGNGPRPVFLRRCAGLRIALGCGQRIEHPMPRVDAVELEQVHDGLRPDVLFFVRGTPVAAIEILATHRIDEVKRARTQLPWVELRAADVLALRDRWIPVQDFFRPLHCADCVRLAQDYAAKFHNGYIRGETRCYKCNRRTTVYSWGGGVWTDKRPPEPRPWTVKLRYSKTVNARYWANTCEHCGALQGDFFLYNEPDGPFFGLSRVVPLNRVLMDRVAGWNDWQCKELLAELGANRIPAHTSGSFQ